nr:MAG TPA: hypothetical protein [Caudoviricetes sp.]
MFFVIITSFIYIYNRTIGSSVPSCVIICPVLFKIT